MKRFLILAVLLLVMGGWSDSLTAAGPSDVGLEPQPFTVKAGAQAASDSIVQSVVKAPIVPDGNVAGAPTDLVIYLNTSLNPDIPGRSLLAGKSIRITLPDAFVNTGELPTQSLSPPNCAPGKCNTGVLLQSWPQHPIRPPVQKYNFSQEGTNTIVYTALEDLVADPPLEPGIKQMHLLVAGFRNPAAGEYQVEVEAGTGPDGAVERGVGTVTILPAVKPGINITSVFNEGTPNKISAGERRNSHTTGLRFLVVGLGRPAI